MAPSYGREGGTAQPQFKVAPHPIHTGYPHLQAPELRSSRRFSVLRKKAAALGAAEREETLRLLPDAGRRERRRRKRKEGLERTVQSQAAKPWG